MSTNSGSTWALVQLAYSQPFFDKAVPRNTNAIQPFILDWLKSLRFFITDNDYSTDPDLINNFTLYNACKLISPTNASPFLLDWENLCLLFTKINISWADLVDQMFLYASKLAYNDPTFRNRVMNETNRIPIFQNTDLYTQLAVLPVSKIIPPTPANNSTPWWLKLFDLLRFWERTSPTDKISYIGPGNSSTEAFTVPIPCQYSVTSKGSGFVYGLHPSMLPLKVYTGPAPNRFRFRDWESYYLYDGINNGSILTELPFDAITDVSSYLEPFDNGIGSVTQVSAASSASLSGYTGIIPAFLAQFLSVQRHTIRNNANLTLKQKRKQLALLAVQANLLYVPELLKDIAVCSEWPKRCQKGNYLLVDGAITDGPSKSI
jgi:hypothetical protein